MGQQHPKTGSLLCTACYISDWASWDPRPVRLDCKKRRAERKVKRLSSRTLSPKWHGSFVRAAHLQGHKQAFQTETHRLARRLIKNIERNDTNRKHKRKNKSWQPKNGIIELKTTFSSLSEPIGTTRALFYFFSLYTKWRAKGRQFALRFPPCIEEEALGKKWTQKSF